MTPLHNEPSTLVAELLLRSGADANAKDKVHTACLFQYLTIFNYCIYISFCEPLHWSLFCHRKGTPLSSSRVIHLKLK